MIGRIGSLFALLILIATAVTAQEDMIRKITILGNAKIEAGVIEGAVKSREGGPFSADQVREDVRAIFALGFFSDVQVDIRSTPEGKEVTFVVVEKPGVKEVLVKGNDKIKYDDIKEKVTITPRSILNLEKVKENAEQIRKLYFSRGYYGVKVDPRINYLDSNEAVITFQIDEGPKGRIRQIRFTGNQKISSSDLRKVMTTAEWNLLSFLTKSGVLDEDVLKNDIQLLTAYYIDHGYLDVKIPDPKVDLRNPKRIRIDIDVNEGPQYRVGNIDFKGDVLTTKEQLFRTIKLRRNDVYSTTAIRRDIGALTELFANRGYAYVDVSPETAVDAKALMVSLLFNIDKNREVFFEKIRIAGNTKTRDKVIRREIQVAEGELYSVKTLNKSRDRLRRTGYFKEVDFTTSRGSAEDRINLDVKVDEAPTGSISFGVGYSTLYSVLGTVAVSDRNLFGMGYHGLLKVSLGTESQDFRASLTDPYFLGTRYSVGGEIYHQDIQAFDTYKYKVTGGDITVGRELTETLRVDTMYKLENVDVYDVEPGASDTIVEQEGKATTSAISVTLTRDTRDDFFAPNRGSRTSVLLQNAGGVLGGDNYFVKGVLDSGYYFPMPLSTVLNLRGKMGMIQPYGGTDVPVYEKFYVGGAGTVRGFEYGKAGPVDEEDDDPLGAKKMIVMNAELVFPLSRAIGLRGAFFVDVGKGFDKTSDAFPLRVGMGAGFRWFSPFGPLNIDIGFNPFRKPGEKSKVIEFGMGSTF
jgi:outer membrane protein insertion porin family